MRILNLIQVKAVILIYHQLIVINLQANEWKLEGRIKNQTFLYFEKKIFWIIVDSKPMGCNKMASLK